MLTCPYYNCLISSRCFLFAYNLHDITRILKTKKKTQKLSVEIACTIHFVKFYDDFTTYKQSDEMNICNKIK